MYKKQCPASLTFSNVISLRPHISKMYVFVENGVGIFEFMYNCNFGLNWEIGIYGCGSGTNTDKSTQSESYRSLYP